MRYTVLTLCAVFSVVLGTQAQQPHSGNTSSFTDGSSTHAPDRSTRESRSLNSDVPGLEHHVDSTSSHRDSLKSLGLPKLAEVDLGALLVDKTPNLPGTNINRVGDHPQPAWLQDLDPSDLPIRWDEQVIAMLEYYRYDVQGQSLIRGWFKRANRYSDMIRDLLRAESLPEDLLYVAMVESGFDPKAESGSGAVGLWQFIPATAEDYGLEQTRWVDQRMNPQRSTEAAILYFKDLYRYLGSWELSLAAFNMGYSALSRAMSKYNTNDFWILSRYEAGLPFETVEYVSKVTACAIIGRNPERFGLHDLELDDPIPQMATVYIPGGTDLKTLAIIADLSEQELMGFNPELKQDRVSPEVLSWPLRISADQHAGFLERWAKAQSLVRSHRKHLLRFGENLSDIAQRYGMSSAGLRELNRLGVEDEVGPGFQLLVPDIAPIDPAPSPSAVVSLPERSFEYKDRRRVFYRVTRQDSLREIARFFQVNRDEILNWNQLSEDAHLPSGMVLELFVPPEVDLSQALVLTPKEVKVLRVGSDEFFDFHEAQRNRIRIRYRVRPGETLETLAERFDLSVGSIARINRFSRDTVLQTDQEIILYIPEKLADSIALDNPTAMEAHSPNSERL